MTARNQWNEFSRHLRRQVFRKRITKAESEVIAIELPGLIRLCAELIGKDCESAILDRNMRSDGHITWTENSPECYGQSIAEQQRHYGKAYSLTSKGTDANCELSETDQVLIKATGHDHETESMEKEL